MTPHELLSALGARGVRLSARGDRLVYDAPAGVMTTELRDRLEACKPELLTLLNPPSAAEPPETHADREIRRFLGVCRPTRDGRGWYDPGSLRDAAGRAYLAYTLSQPEGKTAVDNGQALG